MGSILKDHICIATQVHFSTTHLNFIENFALQMAHMLTETIFPRCF